MKHLALLTIALLLTMGTYGQKKVAKTGNRVKTSISSLYSAQLDSLLKLEKYADAYPIGQEYYHQAMAKGTSHDKLKAAFFLSTLDYAYSKSPADSALMRYRLLAPTLNGNDRAEAYAYLYQIYTGQYYANRSAHRYRNSPSNDPDLPYPLWHWRRMEDTLSVCANEAMKNASGTMADTLMATLARGIELLVTFYHDSTLTELLSRPTRQLASSPLEELMAHTDSSQLTEILYRLTQYWAQKSADEQLQFDIFRIHTLPQRNDNMTAAYLKRLWDYYQPCATDSTLMAQLGYMLACAEMDNKQHANAQTICDQVIRLYPDNYYALMCSRMSQEIMQPRCKMSIPSTITTQQQLAVVEYANISKLNFKLFPYIRDYHYQYNKLFAKIDSMAPIKEWTQQLPDSADHFIHQALIALPNLPQGEYTLVASSSNFSRDNSLLIDISVKDAMFVQSQMLPKGHSARYFEGTAMAGFLMNSISGEPIDNHCVQIDYYYSKKDEEGILNLKTDKLGYIEACFHYNPISWEREKHRRIGGLTTCYGDSILHFRNETYYSTRGTAAFKARHMANIMTDRPVYRLGDTVQAACVIMQKWTTGLRYHEHYKPLANCRVKAFLYHKSDYYSPIDSVEAVSDKQGRVHFAFVLPREGKNGSYRIKVELKKRPIVEKLTDKSDLFDEIYDDIMELQWGTYREETCYFRVEAEAYKIPHFYVTLEADSLPHQFGMPVVISGQAVNYSGAPMQGAKARLNISFLPDTTIAIAADGRFEYIFIPDSNFQNEEGYADYHIKCTVVDGEGETHEKEITIRTAQTDGIITLCNSNMQHLTFAHATLAGKPIEGPLDITVERLLLPDTMYRLPAILQKYPEARWIGSEAEYRRMFPGLAISAAEADYRHTSPKELVAQQRIERLSWSPQGTLPSGIYRVRLAADNGATLDTLVEYVAPNGTYLGDELLWMRHNLDHNAIQRGDTLKMELASSYHHQPVIITVSRGAKIYCRRKMMLDPKVTTFSLPIQRKHDQSISVSIIAVRNGDSRFVNQPVYINPKSQQLSITTESMRNRMEPNQKEQISLRITNASSKPQKANVCLTLFDQSLEQFNHHGNDFRNNNELIYWMSNPVFGYAYFCYSLMDQIYPGYINYPTRLTQPAHYPESEFMSKSLQNLSDYSKQISLLHTGIIRGTVMDYETKEPVPFANVVLKKGNARIVGAQTDFDGNFKLVNIHPGHYEMEVSCVGFNPYRTFGDFGYSVAPRRYNIYLSSASKTLECVEIVSDKNIHHKAIEEFDQLDSPSEQTETAAPIQMRNNLSTLALFAPTLNSGRNGVASTQFTLPGSLTQWRLNAFAWTNRMQYGSLSRTIQTYKELTIQPQLPRFLRQNDSTNLMVKVANLSDSTLKTTVRCRLNTIESDEIDLSFERQITLQPQSSETVSFPLKVNTGKPQLHYRFTASSQHHTDGEEGVLNIQPNRERITQSYLLNIHGAFDTDTLRKTTIIEPAEAMAENDSAYLAFTPNAIDYVMKALPHFAQLKNPSTISIASQLYVGKLEEFFDKEDQQIDATLENLTNTQMADGGWGWMPSSKESDLFSTLYVMRQCAKIKKLDSYFLRYSGYSVKKSAIEYIDRNVTKLYNEWLAETQDTLIPIIGAHSLHLLYTRSLYLEEFQMDKCQPTTQSAYRCLYDAAKEQRYSSDFSLYLQGLLCLTMNNWGDTAEAREMAQWMKGQAKVSDEMGMYWVRNTNSYWWYQRPIETAAVMVDVLGNVLGDWQAVSDIQRWILKSKQATLWHSDMASADALAALMMQPKGYKAPARNAVKVSVNGHQLPVENGKTFDLDSLVSREHPKMEITMANASSMPAWGAVFYSSEKPIDSISNLGTGITLRKTMLLVHSDGSTTLITPGTQLHLGDRIRAHIEISSDRDMDRMVVRDQRAACCEPVNSYSHWVWNLGLSYYFDVRDNETDLYIYRLPEGQYYIEYDMWAQSTGTHSTGITRMECTIAPEFRAVAGPKTLHIE